MRAAVVALALTAGCGALPPRFPADVQTALARDAMRRLETAQLIVYYPAPRRALAERLAARVEACAGELRRMARVDNRHSREKMIVVVPELPFNNAYVLPPVGGLEDVAVIPTGDTLDFVTEFGLPPDPGMTGCHEIVHYVQLKQIAGLWGVVDTVLGSILTPQGGFDPWFLEGLATYYEARLQPGVGRPRWPVFTSMFHAAYPGGDGLGGSSLSEYARLAVPGHHYLVGTIFVGWLAETYGEAALWRLIEQQARSVSIVFDVNGSFDEVYGKDLTALLGEFRGWVATRYPRRARPTDQRVVQQLGTDARWAWAADGTTAIVDADVDRPTRLIVRDAAGRERDAIALVEVVPPRTLVTAAPILTTGLGFTADGRDLYLTALDHGATFQTTRLLRLRVGSGELVEVARDLGSGGSIAPDGATYYALASDGDRWSIVAFDLATRTRRIVWDAPPGQYALRLAVAPDGARLAVSVWDGARFAIWIVDAQTGVRQRALAGRLGGPVYDPAFAPDGRLIFLDQIEGRFQVVVESADGERTTISDAPYGALEARAVGERVRFLAREGWRWTLDEIALPAAPVPVSVSVSVPVTVSVTDSVTVSVTDSVTDSVSVPAPVPARILSDAPYSRLDGLLIPTLRVPTFVSVAPNVSVGLLLGGGDRLGFLQWSAALLVDVGDGRLSGSLDVAEHSLAPWTVAASAARAAFRDRVTLADDSTLDRDRETRGAAIAIGRTWRETIGATVASRYLSDRIEDATLRLWGPSLDLAYLGLESTPYTGPRRGVIVDASAAYYPRRVPDDLIDVGGGVRAIAPLPIGRRHTLALALRGRALLGDDDGLLAVGGIDPASVLWSRPALALDEPGDGLLPSGAAFGESLRGFEDVTIVGSRAALALLAWRYPIIIDRGITHLGFLPSSFLSQLDLELFATTAWIRPSLDPWHHAAGGAMAAHLIFLRAPLVLRYQASRRLTDDRAWLQLVSLGLDL